MGKIRKFIINNWNYVIAFLLPWVLIVVHSIIRESWLMGKGSILSADAGNVYYGMYTELWNKVHQGGSLFYSWNAGLGTDFLVNLFQYMMSPFTILLLLVPKSGIADMLQAVMVLKWSFAAVTMNYYFMHTKHNKIPYHKKLMSLILALAFCFSNTLIQNLSHISWGDVWILFPLLLLLEEKMAEGTGFKRFYICLSVMIICNFRLSISVILFLIIWYLIQVKDISGGRAKNILRYLYALAASVFTGMFVMVPSIMATLHNKKLYPWESMGEYAKSFFVSFTGFIQRLFVCDTLGLAVSDNAMLYLSVSGVAFALLFFFIPKKKKSVILLLFLLIAGLCNGGVNLLWHGYIGVNEAYGSFSFLLAFLLLYMVMIVMGELTQIKMWNVFAVLLAGIVGIVYTFFKITVYLDFYVYLGTFLIYVLILLLLIFYCRKSIQYANMLVVFAVICFGELAINAYIQLEEYNMYPVETSYYHEQSEVLAHSVELQNGERIAGTQIMSNYGFVLNKPAASGELAYTNDAVQVMYAKLGMTESEQYYEYFGGSPLLNVLCNIRYGMGQSALAFSGGTKKGENNGYQLYEMDDIAALGYMVNEDVENWNLDQVSPFEVQNDFVKKAAGEGDIFETVTPEVTCSSLLGGPRLEEEANHVHEEGEEHEEEENPETVVEFDEEKQQFRYEFKKMYPGDTVTAEFESDGVSDYYIYLKSKVDLYSFVTIDGETLFEEQFSGKQKTFHIGVVEKGKNISIISNAVVDDLQNDTLIYQVAAFQKDEYAKVYEKLSRNCYQIEEYGNHKITGKIMADADGIMMTSIPAAKGWEAYVDGKRSQCKIIGEALLGIPLKKGEHKVEFLYHTPYAGMGMILSLAGVLLFAGFWIWEKKVKM